MKLKWNYENRLNECRKAKNEMKTEWVMKFEWMETDNAEKIDWMPL